MCECWVCVGLHEQRYVGGNVPDSGYPRMSAYVRCVWSAHAPVAPAGREKTPGLCPHLSRVDVITSASRLWQEPQN